MLEAEVAKDTFTIGRSSKCDVAISSEGLSREHCSISIQEGDIFITDLGGANGVLIDDERIPSNQKTQYNTSFSLSLGSIEVTKFIIEYPQDHLDLNYGNPTEMSNSSSFPVPTRSASVSNRSPRIRSKSNSSEVTGIHPGLKGMLFICLFALSYFIYTQIFDDSGFEEASHRNQVPSSKKKWNDGSIPTENF